VSYGTPPKVIVISLDGGEYTYRSARFFVHPDGDLEVSDATTRDTIAIWARNQWRTATAPRQ
jgi:hypothetical protein